MTENIENPPKRRRGRPRSQEVLDRDELIFQSIAGSDRAVTKYEIAAGTGVAVSKIYPTLARLRDNGRIAKVFISEKQHYWSDRPFQRPVKTLAPAA